MFHCWLLPLYNVKIRVCEMLLFGIVDEVHRSQDFHETHYVGAVTCKKWRLHSQKSKKEKQQFVQYHHQHLLGPSLHLKKSKSGLSWWYGFRHTFPVFTGLGRCPIVNWDFSGAVSIFGPDALPVVHQWLLPGIETATSRVRVAAHNH